MSLSFSPNLFKVVSNRNEDNKEYFSSYEKAYDAAYEWMMHEMDECGESDVNIYECKRIEYRPKDGIEVYQHINTWNLSFTKKS